MTDTIVRAPPGALNQTLTAKTPPASSAWQANGEANAAFFLPGLAKDNKSEKSSDSENSITKKKKKQDSGVSGDSHSEHSDSNNDSKLNEKIKESLSKRIKSKEQITQEREKIEKLIKTAGDNITNSINQAIINKNNKNGGTQFNTNSILSMAGSKREKTISIDQTQSPILAKKIKVENTDESSEENINVDVVGSSDDEHRLSNAESNDSTIHSGEHAGNMSFPGLQQFHSLLANHNLNSNSLIQQNHSNFTPLPMSSRQRLFAQAETQRRRASRKERIKIRLDELMKQVRYLQREYNKTEAEHLSTSSSSDPESSDEQAVNLLSSIALPGFEHTGLEKLIKKEITNVLVRVREQMTSASFKASGISSNGSTPELMSPSDRLSSPTLSGSEKSHKPTAAEELMKAQAAQAAQTIMPQIKNALKLNEPKFNNVGISNSGISSVTRTLSVQPNQMSPKINLAQNLVSPVNVTSPNQILQNAQLLQTQNSLSAQILPNSQIHAQITPQITPSATPVPQQVQPLNQATLNQATLNQATLNQATLNQASLNQAQLNQAQLNQAQLNQTQLNQTQLQQSQINQQNNPLTTQQSNAPTNTYAYLKQQQLQAQQAQQQLQSQQLQAQQQLQQQAAQNQQQAAAAAAQNPQTNVANAAATQAYQQAYQKALLAAKLSQAQAAQDSLLGRNSGMMNRLPTFGEQMASLQEGYGGGYDISDIYGNIHKEGLTPHHLKKAKLMFFYNRYPSSSVLKSYFTDVRFNRATTSQLIKWFSNFREFFYIHIEKIARQGVTEGMASSDQIKLTRDHELIRVLNNHYNKSNQFEVPVEFIQVAQDSLKQFFEAIRAGKDQDPSWKKVIYKIICKLDSDIPARFKAPQLAELGD